jgi:hypothetical protein
MFTIEYVKDLSYASAEGNSIFLTVKWAEFNEEHKFLAATYDPMPHGVALYNRAKAGEFGAIAPYVAPVVEEQPSTTGSQDL